MAARDLKQVTATGDVVAGPVVLRSVVLTPDGTNAATLAVRDDSGGAVRLTLQCPGAGPSVVWASGAGGALFSTAVHATLTGTGAVASFEYS